MPAYFCLTIQRKMEFLPQNYVELIYSSIIEKGYPFKSGYWFHQDATYDEIVSWNQAKLEQEFQLGFTEHGSNNYMQILFDAPEFSQMRGFWGYNDGEISFNLIIPEQDVLNREGGDRVVECKIAPIRKIGVAIWENDLADVIQTSVELDAGYYSIKKVLNGENVMVHPFAIMPKECIGKFAVDYFAELDLNYIDNNGVLISSDGILPAHLLT